MALTDVQWLFIIIFGINFTLIIDRAHRTYDSFNTYNAWRGYSQALYQVIIIMATLVYITSTKFCFFLYYFIIK